MDKEFIAKRIANIREAKNKSARSLSLDLGMSSEYINQLENGRMNPSLDFIVSFCDYFKISISEFFESEITYPVQYHSLIKDLNKLSKDEVEDITILAKRFASRKE